MGARLSFPIVELTGKVAVVTGANTGIGYETAKALATMGAQTILACRSEERAIARGLLSDKWSLDTLVNMVSVNNAFVDAIGRMKREVAAEFPERQQIEAEFMQLDLASFHSVRTFIQAFKERNHPLDILINNAGVSYVHHAKTEDGFEMHYQINHLGHLLLTLELLPLMNEAASISGDGRIVFVASRMYSHGVFDPTNMNAEHSYDRSSFYNHSKLYNVMTAYALQRRLKNTRITVSSLHPGQTDTEMTRYMHDLRASYSVVRLLKSFSVYQSAVKGAATSVNCAVNPELNSQQCFYYADCKPVHTNATSRDEQLQARLWDISISAVKDYLSAESLEQLESSNTQSGVSQASEHPAHLSNGSKHNRHSITAERDGDRERGDTFETVSLEETDGDSEEETGEEEDEEEESALITTECDISKEMYLN